MTNDILTRTTTPVSLLEFMIGLILTALAAYLLKWVYVKYGLSLSDRASFGNIFIPLAMTTMVIITIVKSSLALSLGLVGALSIVRFRSAIKEPEELVFLFVSIMIGLGFGANQIIITCVGVALLLIALITRRKVSSRMVDGNVMFLTVSKSGPERLNMQRLIEIVSEHSEDVDLKRLDSTQDSSEISFVTNFSRSEDLTALQDSLLSSDPSVEIRFLDTKKVM
ncbi:MAG: DUF4956 domain-containing protein [Paracoccaceae bacterium]